MVLHLLYMPLIEIDHGNVYSYHENSKIQKLTFYSNNKKKKVSIKTKNIEN